MHMYIVHIMNMMLIIVFSPGSRIRRAPTSRPSVCRAHGLL